MGQPGNGQGKSVASLFLALLLVLGACSTPQEKAQAKQAAASESVASQASKAAQIDRALGLDDWPPTGMKDYGSGLAWVWTPKDSVDCKSYQDGCYGITVSSKYGCSGGVYIELAIVDASGAAIDKDITAELLQEGVAKAVLSPPGGTPTGAQARLSKLNCLG